MNIWDILVFLPQQFLKGNWSFDWYINLQLPFTNHILKNLFDIFWLEYYKNQI